MPQHFQQSDILQRNILSYHLSVLDPYRWGIIDLQIDESLLISGVFRVFKLEAILPDGAIIFFPQNMGDVLEIDLKKFLKKNSRNALKDLFDTS